VTVRVIGPKDPYEMGSIDTTSQSVTWSRGLSPFYLGPVPLYTGAVVSEALRMENGWQYAKVYPVHMDEDGNPTEAYYAWAQEGWVSSRASRYPMGKGARPEYSWWAGEKLTYLEARKRIYLPMYARAVVKTRAFDILMREYLTRGKLTLWDFDGYDHHALGMTFEDVLACGTRKMGHALVLSMLLETFAGNLAARVSGGSVQG